MMIQTTTSSMTLRVKKIVKANEVTMMMIMVNVL